MLYLPDNRNILQPQLWVNNYADELYRYAMGKTSKTELAEDWVQETFLQALKAKDNFKGQSNERTWLYAILKNTIASYYRKASTKNEKTAGPQNTETNSNYEDYFNEQEEWQTQAIPGNWQNNPAATIENKELAAALDKCLQHLPETQKQVIIQKLMEETDTKTICKDLSISESNYWILIHRAKLQLRACLEKSWINTH